jgi:hypothetical protein
MLGFGEGLVVLGRIKGCAQDDGVGRGQISGPVTQALTLASSTGRGRLGVPPENDPMALLISQ